MAKKIVPNRLKELRMEKRLTTRELAQYLNINHSSINQFENQQHEFSMERLIKTADFFRVSLDYILYRSNSRLMAHQVPTITYRNKTEQKILMAIRRISDESTLEIIKGVVDAVSNNQSKTIIDTQDIIKGDEKIT